MTGMQERRNEPDLAGGGCPLRLRGGVGVGPKADYLLWLCSNSNVRLTQVGAVAAVPRFERFATELLDSCILYRPSKTVKHETVNVFNRTGTNSNWHSRDRFQGDLRDSAISRCY